MTLDDAVRTSHTDMGRPHINKQQVVNMKGDMILVH